MDSIPCKSTVEYQQESSCKSRYVVNPLRQNLDKNYNLKTRIQVFLIIGMPRTYFLGHRGIVLCIIMVMGKCILFVAFLVKLFYYFAFPFALCIHNCCGYFMFFFCRRCELLLWVTFPVCLIFLDRRRGLITFMFKDDEVTFMFQVFFLDLVA